MAALAARPVYWSQARAYRNIVGGGVRYSRGSGRGRSVSGNYRGVSGLGASAPLTTGQKIATGAAGGVLGGITTAITTGSKVAGGVAASLALIAPFTGPAAPFVALAAAMVAPIASLFKGCGDTCVQATQYADQAGAVVQKLHDTYFAQPVRYRSMQVAALGLIDDTMAQLHAACGNPALGAAGQRCISERLVRGGTAPWCPTSTGCDWFTTIRDPIANDPGVQPDPPEANAAMPTDSSIQSAVDSILPALGITRGSLSAVDLLIPAGLILAGVLL